jgi:hypothetical protein
MAIHPFKTKKMKNFPFFPVFFFICGVIVGCWLHGCGCGKQGFEDKGDTLAKKSTVTIDHSHDSTASYQPKIDFIEGGKIPDSQPGDFVDNGSQAVTLPGNVLPLWTFMKHPSSLVVSILDTAAIIESYLQKVGYKDTIHTKYGFVRIYDTVTQNRIIARRVFTDFDVPLVTNTITIRDKPRVKGYLGANGFVNLNELSVGPSFALKLKNDQIIEAGAMINTRSQWTYLFSMKFPISFKKR